MMLLFQRRQAVFLRLPLVAAVLFLANVSSATRTASRQMDVTIHGNHLSGTPRLIRSDFGVVFPEMHVLSSSQ